MPKVDFQNGMIEWTYITNDDNSARYTLGKLGERMLFFIGINPSTARPEDLDGTVTRVKNFARDNGYDGWIMLNVYPQRARNPNDIHDELNAAMHLENLEVIRNLVATSDNFDVCAAWGTEINRRKFLPDCLRDVAAAMGHDTEWFHLNQLTKHKHPRHPLYLPSKAKFYPFDVTQYLESL